MKRYSQITRQSYYCFSFRFSSADWNGIGVAAFRQALGAETGLRVETTYEPLNDCALYQPHTKRRHRLNEEYWRAIDPSRFELPVCQKAFADEAVVIGHPFLLGDRADMDEVAKAVEKIYDNREELRNLA